MVFMGKILETKEIVDDSLKHLEKVILSVVPRILFLSVVLLNFICSPVEFNGHLSDVNRNRVSMI